jgi:hypothetical protein
MERLFWKTGHKITGHKLKFSYNLGLRRFKAFFGVTPKICAIIWNLLSDLRPVSAKPKYLLWSLCFLKQYNTENLNHAIFGADEKTIRKWIWYFVRLLSELDIVRSFNI